MMSRFFCFRWDWRGWRGFTESSGSGASLLQELETGLQGRLQAIEGGNGRPQGRFVGHGARSQIFSPSR